MIKSVIFRKGFQVLGLPWPVFNVEMMIAMSLLNDYNVKHYGTYNLAHSNERLSSRAAFVSAYHMGMKMQHASRAREIDRSA